MRAIRDDGAHHTINRGMTRIGFTYNLKPDLPAGAGPDEPASEVTAADDEPPSIEGGRDRPSHAAPAVAEAPVPDDEFAEWDTRETIDAVAGALGAFGTVVPLEATHDLPERLRRARVDIVFNIAEGLGGKNREALVPAICEFYGIPYSGSDPLALALCLDKGRTKEVLSHHGIPTAPFVVVESADDDVALALDLPLFVKPVHEGSSKGITERSFCQTREELRSQVAFLIETYAQPVVVEQYLPGAEFTCAVLGNGPSAYVLPIVGMNFDALPPGAVPVYGFEAKWVWDRPDAPLEIFDCPARIPEALQRSIERVTLRAYRALACRDWSRIDIRLDAQGVPNVVEVNPLPGILPDPSDNSCFPKAARAAGISYEELIQTVLTLAAERQHVPLAGRRAGHAAP